MADEIGASGSSGSTGDDDRATDRRSLIKKLGVGAAVAWTAPSIVSVTAAAAATVSPLCGGCAAPPLINPGAETGTTVGWTAVNAGVRTWLTVNTVPPPGAGLFTFLINGVGSLGQSVTVPPECLLGAAHTYSLGFWYSAAFDATAFGAEVEFFQGVTSLRIDSTVLPSTPNPTPPPGFVMVPGTLSGPIPAGADSVLVTFRAFDADALVDLVTLTFC